MRILMNFREAMWLSGGANSFLSGLRRRLCRNGISFTRHINDDFDIALLNALTDGLTLDQLRRIRDRGRPIIHRKVGYKVSGSAQMRSVVDGVVHGDRMQIDFSPYIDHTIFQSCYSRDTFLSEGFSGDYSVILNGADTDIFNRSNGAWWRLGSNGQRQYWDGKEPFRFAAVTWSRDPNKGFDDYLRFDAALEKMSGVEIWFIGRYPVDLQFRNMRIFSPRGHRRLASLLRRCHGFIQMARFETCSNALIEAINSGLPVVYADSGSAREIAANYGVEYRGCAQEAMETLIDRYAELAPRTRDNPYTMDRAASDYLRLIEARLGGTT